MTEPLLRVLNRMRSEVLAPETFVRAVASGRQRGTTPRWRRVELRYVDLKAGRHLQLTAYDATQAHTSNHAVGQEAQDAVDDLIDEPFGNWHVETLTHTHQVRVTKRLEAVVHTAERTAPADVGRGHDRDKERLLPIDDPVYRELGLTDAEGRVKPSRQSKLRQVEEFLRQLDVAVAEALEKGHLRRPTADEPLRVVDLGCGNAYLTVAAHRFLSHVRDLPVEVVGADVKQQSREHGEALAERLGAGRSLRFVEGTIDGVALDPAPEVVLALHACDTATDDALARAVAWRAPVVLAAPCCHHDLAAQLRRAPTPAPYALLTRHGILRERLADTLTDGVRAALMRLQGYRVEVVQFVESQHTPRNTLLRCVRTGSPVAGGSLRTEYDDLVDAWGVSPRLATLLEG
ncbi:SAM-dependent methyltransferase [Nocardioides sp. TRM66260-LWL]|uniref:class I SAM-dependent methyltransferase n=1 Tax=Nocardioides sp. TRM66260-LWL TaxID=2874478 RepID=UPI001CC7FEA8|nr:SAM-dependent methyltransferase [Nocardioides sp. TRM66260-LWL]MBZ5735217.1 SAM-dependent methyltransferase [Nocardioides sp. TRM66260-LWL]